MAPEAAYSDVKAAYDFSLANNATITDAIGADAKAFVEGGSDA